MNQDLERELIEFPLKVNSRIACNLRRSSQSGQLDASGTALKKTKQRVLLMLVMGFLAYRWLYSSSL